MTPVATVHDNELPDDLPKLIAYADAEQKKRSIAGAQNALKALDKARTKDEKSYDVQWRIARAYVFLGDELDDATHMEEFAQRAMDAAKAAVAADPTRVEGQYYLGTSTGQYTFVKKVKAKELVPKVVEAALAAVKIDERYDYAGPLRLLGAVYSQAPEPPTSVGDHEEGPKLLARAIQLAGSYPQNHLLMADAHLENRNLDQAEREYNTVLSMKPKAESPWASRYPKWEKQAHEGLRRVSNLRRQNASDRGSPF